MYVYMNSTQYTISEPRRNNNNSNSKGKSLFYGLHVPFFVASLSLSFSILKHITHEPELIYCILLFFFFYVLHLKQNKRSERQNKMTRNRMRKQYPNALWYSRFTALKSIYTLLHTLFLLFLIFYIVYPRQSKQASK